MAITRMTALTMVGPKTEMDAAARRMVLTGSFQPLPLDLLVTDRTLRSRVTTAVENPYDELLTKLSSIWRAAGEPLPAAARVPLTKDFSLAKARQVVGQAAGRLAIWEGRRKALIEEEELLTAAKIFIKALQGLNLSADELTGSQYAVPFFGRISGENLERLTDSAEEAPIAVSELYSAGASSWVLVLTVSSYREATRKLLDAVYFKEYPLSEIAMSIARRAHGEDPLPIIEKRLENHEKAINALAKAAKDALSVKRADYELLYSKLYTLQRVYDLCKGRGEINGMFAISGWIPEDSLAEVRETLEKEAPSTMLLVEDTKGVSQRGMRVPTLLRNNRFFRVFQEIVAMYSLPSYGEIDPSPIVAITFTLFFGFMFGDIGHGLLIFLGAHYLAKRGLMSRQIGLVLKTASISSVIFGALYGSVFGIEGVIPPLWLSPMHDTDRLLAVAICIGVVMISFGMMLNMARQYMARDFGQMLFDGGGLAGLTLYWTLTALTAAKMTGISLPGRASGLMWAIAGLMLLAMVFKDTLSRLLLRQKTHKHSVVMNIFEIIHSLLGFLSNTASFVRLAAFALNHVGLSLAVIMLSDMVRGLPGGLVMKGLVFIAGNLVIVCLEGLIVFIQTLRLEYYEFFGKFYRGGGSAFRPVSWKR